MIRVGIVDDHAIVRAGSASSISPSRSICGWPARPPTAARRSTSSRKGEVDVLVMDLSMPDQSGVDALAADQGAQRPSCRC